MADCRRHQASAFARVCGWCYMAVPGRHLLYGRSRVLRRATTPVWTLRLASVRAGRECLSLSRDRLLGCFDESLTMVDLYNSAYGNFADEAYRQVRIEAYGHDLGQTSWVTTEESAEIPRSLGLTDRSNV